MIKVCHMTCAHNSKDERIYYKECISLSQVGYDVYLTAPGESFEENGVHVVGIGEKPASRIKRITQTAKLVYKKALELDADIYHFHDPELLPYGLKLKRKGKIVIFDSHEFYGVQIQNKTWIPPVLRRVISKIYTLYEEYVCRRFDAVVAVGIINSKNYFENRARHVVIIANYPLLSEFGEAPKREKLDKAICYVGGLSEERGITNAVMAAAKAKATLYLAGKFTFDGYKEKLQELPQWKNVTYEGLLNRQQISELLSSCSIGISVLQDVGQYFQMDTFPVKVLEYMAAGLPVIVSNSFFLKNKISEHDCGICVDPENADQIADAIKYLFDNPDEAKRMGKNGRRAVLEMYNWGVEEKKLMNLYKSLLK